MKIRSKWLKAEHFITISQLIGALEEAREKHGDAFVATTYDGASVPLKQEKWAFDEIEGPEGTFNVLFIAFLG